MSETFKHIVSEKAQQLNLQSIVKPGCPFMDAFVLTCLTVSCIIVPEDRLHANLYDHQNDTREEIDAVFAKIKEQACR